MGVMERRVLVDGWRAWRWTCEQELQDCARIGSQVANGREGWKGRAEEGREGDDEGEITTIITRKSMASLPDSCTTADSSVASNCAISNVGWLLCRAVSGSSGCLGLTNVPDQRPALQALTAESTLLAARGGSQQACQGFRRANTASR